MIQLRVCLQLEDVNNAYDHDEIRFEEKHKELLTRFETERTQDKTKYEVCTHCGPTSLMSCVVTSHPQSESDTTEGDREAGVGEEDTRSHSGLGGHET